MWKSVMSERIGLIARYRSTMSVNNIATRPTRSQRIRAAGAWRRRGRSRVPARSGAPGAGWTLRERCGTAATANGFASARRAPASAAKYRPAGEARPLAEGLLDPQKLVVLGDALAAGRRPGLDLSRAGRDREIGDRDVLGLARTVRHNGGVAGGARHRDRLE